MSNKILPERIEVLKNHGFVEKDGGGLAHAFRSQTMVLDAKMFVNGDHATDYSHIYYACEQTEFYGLLDGLFYSPSMLEYLLIDFNGDWDPERMVRGINSSLASDFRLVSVGGYPMLFTEIYNYEWKKGNISEDVSEMLKLIGTLDYILSRKRRSLIAKRKRAAKKK